MALILRDGLNNELKKLSIDSKLIKKINQMQISFVNKNEDHINFFGGHLLGCYSVKFLPADENRWFEEILETDKSTIEKIVEESPGINKDFKVSSDPFNLSCVWLLQAIHNSSKISSNEKYKGMKDTLLLMQFRFLTSRLNAYFKYLTTPDIAEMTYSELSNRFLIKIYGTWYNVFSTRAEKNLIKNSLHYNAFTKMNNDKEVVDFVNDEQGRIRDMIKNIYEVFMIVHKSGNKIKTTSDLSTIDGVEILKDKIGGVISYTQYIKSLMIDEKSFIKAEVLNSIQKVMQTTPPHLLTKTLLWISQNFTKEKDIDLSKLIENVMVHCYDHLNNTRLLYKSRLDLVSIIVTMRGTYMSSRASDPLLLQLREDVEKIVTKATGNKNKNVTSSVRTAVLLYIIARAFTKQYYN